MKTRIALFLILIALYGCEKPRITKQEMKEILNERNEKLGQLFKAGDADKLAEMYSDSAKLCPNGADLYIGRAAINQFWKNAMDGYQLLEMTTETITVDGNEEIIYETGKTTSKLMFKDSVFTSQVKFANIWKKQADGSYLLDVDIWNSL